MALARARGCAGRGSPRGRHAGQADACRRQNGPRKATSCRLITVRLRSKSCLAGRYRVSRTGRRAVVAIEAANPSAPKTDSGAYSTDESNLQGLSGKHQLVDLVLDYREIAKLNSTYVKPMLNGKY